MLMRCARCQTWRLPARQHCDVCLSDEYTWEQASGRGVVRTFGIMHQRYHPAFEVPYNVTIVELEEGPRIPDESRRRRERGHRCRFAGGGRF